ncbi:antitoxin [Actinomadura opuntiae]|uniref:antitoxin n=1 Tax=Actinomadura sp. OS1-43 TaxID=604315 RepID=UPI00255B4080|nr:antitoxin [Actinomadura sp. OS1-43]MDL4818094.1 antitoxin [Actinomadura sp. OS1-43]
MSFMDKVKEMLGQHPDQAKSGVEKAGDMFDQKTGGKYADKVDKAQEKAGDYIDRGDRRAPGSGTEGGPEGGMPGANKPH